MNFFFSMPNLHSEIMLPSYGNSVTCSIDFTFNFIFYLFSNLPQATIVSVSDVGIFIEYFLSTVFKLVCCSPLYVES
jgi:hypothetical protein